MGLSRTSIPSTPSMTRTLIRARYDDGGYSGGSTDRPALQRLLADVKAGKIDVIVVYKVDSVCRARRLRRAGGHPGIVSHAIRRP
jgi:DNA invertase Pin-like site-specific DNA recombinase